jgi:hypothetical protein
MYVRRPHPVKDATAMPHPASPRRALLCSGLAALAFAAPASAAWTTPFEISDAANRDASALQVDAAATGDAVAAWNTGTAVAAVYLPAGGTRALTRYEGIFGPPTVGVGGSGVAALSFHALSVSTSRAIMAASRPAGGAAFGAAAAIEGPSSDNRIGKPILAVNDTGTALMLYDRGNSCDACTHPMAGRALTDPAANTWSAASNVSSYQSETYNRVIATAADGSAVVLFKTNNGTQARSVEPVLIAPDGSTSKGASIDGSSGNLSGALTNPSGIAVARTPSGDVVAALERKAGTGGGIFVLDFAKARAGAGTGAPPETRVSDDTDGFLPELATDAAGNALVSWYDPSDGGEDLPALRARYRPAGGTWGPTETLATGALDGHDLAMDAAGTAYAVFVDDAGDAVVARTRTSGAAGAWSTAQTLSSGLSGVTDARVAAGPDNRAFAAFTADNGVPSGRAVYATTADVTPAPPGDPEPTPTPPATNPSPSPNPNEGKTPPVLVPVTPARVLPKLSSRVTPGRDRRSPYRFTTTGKLTRPAGVTATAGCAGKVRVTFKSGKLTVSSRLATVTKDCTYRSRVTFRIKRRVRPNAPLKVSVRFAGNGSLLPARASVRTVRVR